MRSCQEYFDARDETVPIELNIELAITFQHYTKLLSYAAEYAPKFSELDNAEKLRAVQRMVLPLYARLDDFTTTLVSAMRLATRILRGTRAQISDMHARKAAERQFMSVISSLCSRE